MKTRNSFVVLGVGLLLTGMAWAGPTITKVTVTKQGDGAVVRVQGTDLPQPTFSRSNAGKAWIASFKASLAVKPQYVSLKQPKVRYVQYGWFSAKPPVVNVLAWIDSGVQPVVEQGSNGDWLIWLGVASPTAPAVEQKPAVAPKPVLQPQKPVDAVRENNYEGKADLAEQQRQREAQQGRVRAAAPQAAQRPPLPDVKVSLEFPKADVVVILRALAQNAGVNIVTAPDVRGEITVSMRDENVRTALELITTMAGYRYALVGRTYVVGTEDFLKRFATAEAPPGQQDVPLQDVTEFVPVTGSPQEIAESLQALMPSVKVMPGPAGGAPVVAIRGPAPEVQRARMLLTAHLSQDEVIEVYTARHRDAHDLKTYFQGAKNLVPGVLAMVGPSALGMAAKQQAKGAQTGSTAAKTKDTEQAAAAKTTSGAVPDELQEAAGAMQEEGGKAETKPAGGGDTGPASGDDRKLVLKGPRAAVDKALEILAVLDVPFDQVTEVYVAKHLSSRSLQSLFSGGTDAGGKSGDGSASLVPGVKVTEGPMSIVPAGLRPQQREPEPSRHLLVTGPRDQVAQALHLLAQLDMPEPQVIIEAKVMDVLRDDLDKLGVKWDLFDNGVINVQNIERASTGETQQNVRDGNSQTNDKVGNNTFEQRNQYNTTNDWQRTFETLGDPIVNTFNMSFNPKTFIGSINGILDALVVSKRSKLLASPKVSALDGRPARIFIGDIVKYVEQISQTTTGPTITIGEVQAGILLNATPRVAPDNSVTLSLATDVSLITAFNDVPGGGKLPQVASRNVDTNIRMRDGETIVIGGLIREEELMTMTKVPLLGDLPFLGQLFRHRSKTKTGSEVVLFLTVRVVQE